MFSLTSSAALQIASLILAGASPAPIAPLERPKPAVEELAPAQAASREPEAAHREYWVSWGYNGDVYGRSDMHFVQPSLGNDFTLAAVHAHDSKAWTRLFSHDLFVPQYNMRIGFFLNEKWGFELALDHLKWIVGQDQTVRMTGMRDGAPVDTEITLTPDVIEYQLNNGANPVFFNLIRRFALAGQPRKTGQVSLLAKAGGGFAWPHTENRLFGENNDAGFQPFHGWNLDAGAAIRANLYRRLYFELEGKVVYARYFGVKIHEGKAGHSLEASEFVLNFGLAFK